MAKSQRESARRMVRTGMREARPVPTIAPRMPPTIRLVSNAGVESSTAQVHRSADQRQAQAECEIGSDDAAGIERREAEKRKRCRARLLRRKRSRLLRR